VLYPLSNASSSGKRLSVKSKTRWLKSAWPGPSDDHQLIEAVRIGSAPSPSMRLDLHATSV
jgi:hypothetical protein